MFSYSLDFIFVAQPHDISDLCQYHTVLITVILWYNLKSKSLIPPADSVFYRAEILNFSRVQLVNFCFLSWVMPLVLHLKCHFQTQSHLDFSPLLSSRGFMVLHFTFRCMLNFELYFGECYKICIYIFFCMCISSFSIIYWKYYLFFIVLPLILCQRSVNYIYKALILGPLSVSLIYLSIFSIILLKSGSVSPPTWFFSFNIVLDVLGLLSLHINFRISLLISRK